MYDVLCIGICLIDSIIKGFDHNPVSKSGYYAKSNTLSIGGEAFNVGVTTAKLGLNVAIMTCLGDDLSGEIIINELNRSGVDTSNCLRSKDIITPVSTLFVGEDGSRKSITGDGHRYNFHPEKYIQTLNNTKTIVLGSLFRSPFDDVDVIYQVLSEAKRLGITTYVDTKLPNNNILSLDDIKKCLPLIDYIFPNYDEASYYTGKEDCVCQADVLLSYGVSNVIIKLGDKGCYFKNKDEEYKFDSLNVNAIDTSGAGDNFIAGFITYKNEGKTNYEALDFANKCGALSCEYIGTTSGIKNREQVLERFD